MAEHPLIDSHGYAHETCRVEWWKGGGEGVTHVMYTDGKPMCMLHGSPVDGPPRDEEQRRAHPFFSEWVALGEQQVTCKHCLNGAVASVISGREPTGSWGTARGDVSIRPPADFQSVPVEERQRRMARKLPLDTPWRNT